jgi:hypothetical protein
MMRNGAELFSDKLGADRWMRSQIIGAMERQPCIELCGYFIFAVAVLARILEGAERLMNVIMEANIFDLNDGGMLCADNQYSSTLFSPFFFHCES